MVSLSEANYSLALDYSVPQEQDQQPLLSQDQRSFTPVLEQKGSPNSFVLYQKNYSSSKKSADASQGKVDTGNPSNFEVDMYRSTFQLEMFLRSFFISFFYASGIGMILSALFWCFHSKFYRNYLLYTDSLHLRIAGITNICIFLSKWLYLIDNQAEKVLSNTTTYQLYLIGTMCMGTALVEGYSHKKFVKVLKTVKFGNQSLSSTRFRMDYFWSSSSSLRVKELEKQRKAEGLGKEEIRKEKDRLGQELKESEMMSAIQTTISRLKINMSLYYISFFERTSENLQRELKEQQDLAVIEKGDCLIYNEMVPEENILNAITDFEREIFEYKFCTKSNQTDDKKAYAYTLALDLLLNKKQKSSGTFTLFAIAYFAPISILVFLGVFFLQSDLNWSMGQTIFWMFVFPPIELFAEFLPYTNILFFIFQGINIMKSKYIYMKELESLMSANGGKSSYPTLNILDFKSLEAWARLRKIFMHLYDDKLQGIILTLTFVMIVALIMMIRVIWILFMKSPAADTIKIADKYLMSQWIVQALCYLAIFLIFAYYAARVNRKFKAHCNIIRLNKQIAISLYNYYPDFIAEENVLEPVSYIEDKGLEFLMGKYRHKITLEIEAKMKKDYEKLIETYDNILEELNYEEANSPIRILGIPMTTPVVKSFGAVLASIATPMIKQGLTYLFSEKTATE